MSKIFSLQKLLRKRKNWARQGLRVVFTNGVFDILHVGHLSLLQRARSLGDVLVVGVNSDASVRRLGKGPARPINLLKDRCRMLAALSCVDAVVAFGQDTPEQLLSRLKPDVLVKGADYRKGQVAGRKHAAQVALLPLKKGHSTTSLVRQLGLEGNPKLSKRTSRVRPLRRFFFKSALILLNGEAPPPQALRRLASRASVLLCADGGARHAQGLNFHPKIVIGDMDSLPKSPSQAQGATYVCDFDENLSDFEKVLRFAASRGCRKAWIVGAWGGRIDHQLVNLSLAERYARTIEIILVAKEGIARLLSPGRYTLRCKPQDPLTLLPITQSSKLSASGLRYALKAQTLTRGSHGLSNRAISRVVRLEVHRGLVWAIQPGS